MRDPLQWLDWMRQHGLGLDRQLRAADRLQHQMRVPTPDEIAARYFDTGTLAERQTKRAAFHWLRSGLPCVHLGHRLAAEMLYSDVEDAPDLPLPWPSFAVYLPPGLLRSSVACLVATGVTADEGIWVLAANGEGVQSVNVNAVHELLSANDQHESGGEAVPWPVCHRLIVLVCAELAEHRPTQAPPPGNEKIKRDKRTEEPVLWNFQLTRPVTIDCRQEVAEWARSERSHDAHAISVRTHVRGHYRRVVHGKGRALRKREYIHPHPRGGKDDPLAVKHHKLGDD